MLKNLFGPPDIEKLYKNRDIKALINALEYRKDVQVAILAAEKLFELAPIESGKAFAQLLEHPEARLRQLAALTLVKLRDPLLATQREKLIPVLRQAMLFSIQSKDLKDEKASMAILGLMMFHWQPTLDETGAWFWIFQKRFTACVSVGQPAIQPLLYVLEFDDLLQSQSREISATLAKILAQSGDPVLQENVLNPFADWVMQVGKQSFQKGIAYQVLLNFFRQGSHFRIAERINPALVSELGISGVGMNLWHRFAGELLSYTVSLQQIESLRNLLSFQEFDPRFYIVQALYFIGIRSTNPELCDEALKVIQTLSEREGGSTLDGHEIARFYARSALPEGIPILHKWLAQVNADHVEIASALAQLGDEEGKSLLKKYMLNPAISINTRWFAAGELEKSGWQPTDIEQSFIFNIVTDRIDAIFDLGPEVIPLLCSRVASPRIDFFGESSLKRAIRVLGKFKDDRAIPALLTWVNNTDYPEYAEEAVFALVEIGSLAAAEALMRYAAHSENIVNRSAKNGLQMLQAISG